jgi:biotin-dependent carboxylase-like uncharacterized protein
VIGVIQPGILASVQDLGRVGYRSLGVGVSGAMDKLALRIANALVGNAENAAGIETTLGGFLCRFDIDCFFAVTGACSEIYLDEQPVPAWSVVSARAGQILNVASPRIGMRGYIAIAGGIDVPLVMGSRATDLKGNFGGYLGRPLRQGDRLELLSTVRAGNQVHEFGLSTENAGLELDEGVTPVRMIPAAEWNDYSDETQKVFLSTNWQIDQVSNRVGYRLVGPPLKNGNPTELLSHGILPGTIQLPPSGQPVVQMVDANTCGGYPKLGVVIEADLSKLGQVQLGEAVRFTLVTPNQALCALRAENALLSLVSALSTLAMGDCERSQVGNISFAETENVIVSAPARGILRWRNPNQRDVNSGLAEGDVVERGQLLCYLSVGISLLPIRSPVSGKIEKLIGNDQQRIAFGAPVVSLRMN